MRFPYPCGEGNNGTAFGHAEVSNQLVGSRMSRALSGVCGGSIGSREPAVMENIEPSHVIGEG